MTQQVSDKRAEIGINLSVVIQGLILFSVAGFGNYIHTGLGELNLNIKELTREISDISTITSVNKVIIDHNTKAIFRLSEKINILELRLDDHIDTVNNKKDSASR